MQVFTVALLFLYILFFLYVVTVLLFYKSTNVIILFYIRSSLLHFGRFTKLSFAAFS